MRETKVTEGVGAFVADYDGDFLKACEGAAFSDGHAHLYLEGLLPENIPESTESCAEYGRLCIFFKTKGVHSFLPEDDPCKYYSEDGICRPPIFKFKITVEIDEVKEVT